jgi:transposase InsO family protein
MLRQPLIDHGIKMGRDKLYNLLADHGMLIKRKKRRPFTTDSNHPFFKYGNLVRDVIMTRINQIWVSDITYIRVANGYAYLSLVTDAYSRKIIGYCLHGTLGSTGPLKALQMAINDATLTSKQPLIHHSDRGLQYCCADYITLLRKHFIAVSMTQNGDPYENAIAERVNGILKIEFGLHVTFRNMITATEAVEKAIHNYNNIRPHMSLHLKTPFSVHKSFQN